MKFVAALFGILVLVIVNPIGSYVLGGWKDIDIADVPKEVSDYGVRFAFAGVGGKQHAVRLIGITGAKSQTTAGKGYKLDLKTETTSCPPSSSPDEVKDSKLCPILYSSTCTVEVFKSQNTTVNLSIKTASCNSVL